MACYTGLVSLLGFEMKTAFLTGATGFLGGHLAQLLANQDWHVTALSRSIPKNPLQGVNYVTGDVLDSPSLQRSMETSVDSVFHLASDTNTWRKHNPRQTAINIQGTQNLMDVALAKQAKSFLYVSSIVTWGVDHPGLVHTHEQDAQHGLQSWVNYVKTKSQAERMVKKVADRMRVVIANPTHIIGPADQHNWIRLFKLIIKNDLPTIPQGAGSFADVRDVANGIIQVHEKGENGDNYILGGNNLSFPEFIEAVCQAWNLTVDAKVLPKPLIKVFAHLQSWLAYLTGKTPDITPESLQLISHQYAVSSDKAKQQLGYTIRPLNDSLADIQKDLIQRQILKP